MKTKNRLISVIYYNQVSHSKTRGHSKPSYTKNELIEWVMNHKDFEALYNKWIESGCKRKLVPSVDRLKNDKGYSFDNIQLTTFGANEEKSHKEHKEAKLIFDNKAVNQYECIRGKRIGSRGATPLTKGRFINRFISISEASRQLKINLKNISSTCLKKRRHAGGFMWEFAK